jgi:S-adenosylmethionine:tRNA ribosyltransferase-isomerase
MLTKNDFTYQLPPELIAQTPMEPRDASRLLVLNRTTEEMTHTNFRVLPSFLRKGDILVRNNSKVIKARLFGYKHPTGGRIEILLNKLKEVFIDQCVWECIVRPGIAVGQELTFGNGKLTAQCIGHSDDGYTRHIAFRVPLTELYALIDEIGETPLPPYIEKNATDSVTEQQYQTTYARDPGSVAAPTAGLHFTPQLDEELHAAGIGIAEVTLHVGLGTFLPVKTEAVSEHSMHAEHFTLSPETAALITDAKRTGRRIIAVGTTTCRVLESCATIGNDGTVTLTPQSADTSIFIYPPRKFACVDALITNFHLPESTLLMLISAFVSQPNTEHSFTTFSESCVGKAYSEAIAQQYRFFSFGDAMLIQ